MYVADTFSSAVSILLYYSLIFLIVDIGTNPHLNLFVSGLLELPLIPVCYITLKKLRRRVLYLFLYLPSLLASIGLACLPPGLFTRPLRCNRHTHLIQLYIIATTIIVPVRSAVDEVK